ncbi:LuxR family transcriptional regulator [Mycobacterium sp. 852002-51163_SCH5372311]|uniref:response regulator transcription factor n=1 Tax=Mycobacterium sp. 852002-51163_SCH5372311 TaxID=1834097 RepID=UPI000800DAA4|nr:response regulator transcription factor [Mycobacterium sp. 852002-51163_SCH5372311]OBF91058.1 LuxR family transcriptional regulator [Mycobacterium sp. 852002-51163_SCH5372311]
MSAAGGVRPEISIVIIDGQYVVHAGIEAWLSGTEPPIKVVGNYSYPAEFMSVDPAATSEVDAVLFALQYDDGPEFGALRQLCQAGNRVIVYSYLVSDEIILNSLDAGAVSYVAKSESGNHLFEAICSARTDTPYVAPTMAKALLRDRTVGRPRLSTREREVLIAWFQTENKEQVAKRLFIEPTTVRTHLQRARAKYAAAGRPAPTKSALVARAIQDGILSVHDL